MLLSHPRQPFIEIFPADAKYARGLSLVAAGRRQNLANVIDFDFGERWPAILSISLRRGQAHTLCQVADFDSLADGNNYRALNDVCQLANVAREVVRLQ